MGCSPQGYEQSDTTERLHFTFHFHVLEKEMATHSSALAWRIPWTEEPVRLQSMVSQELGITTKLLTTTGIIPQIIVTL